MILTEKEAKEKMNNWIYGKAVRNIILADRKELIEITLFCKSMGDIISPSFINPFMSDENIIVDTFFYIIEKTKSEKLKEINEKIISLLESKENFEKRKKDSMHIRRISRYERYIISAEREIELLKEERRQYEC